MIDKMSRVVSKYERTCTNMKHRFYEDSRPKRRARRLISCVVNSCCVLFAVYVLCGRVKSSCSRCRFQGSRKSPDEREKGTYKCPVIVEVLLCDTMFVQEDM